MIKPNFTEKSLIPYSAADAMYSQRLEVAIQKLNTDLKCTSSKRVCLFCKSRYGTYLFFLSLFFLLSTFSCCLYFEKSDYGRTWSLDVVEKFKQHGYTFPFIVTNFGWVLAYRLLSFVLSFSIFASTSAFVCSCRVFFMSAYFFASTIGNFTHQPIYIVFAYVLVFAAICFFDILFFAETVKPGESFKVEKASNVTFRRFFLFSLYMGTILLLVYLQLSLAVFGL